MPSMPASINGFEYSFSSITAIVGRVSAIPFSAGAGVSIGPFGIGAGVGGGSGSSGGLTIDGVKSLNFDDGFESAWAFGQRPIPRGRSIGTYKAKWSIEFYKGYGEDFLNFLTTSGGAAVRGWGEAIFTMTVNFRETMDGVPSLPLLGRMLVNARILTDTEDSSEGTALLTDKFSGDLQIIGRQQNTGQPWIWPVSGNRLPPGLVPS